MDQETFDNMVAYGVCHVCHAARMVRRVESGDTIWLSMVCSADATHSQDGIVDLP